MKKHTLTCLLVLVFPLAIHGATDEQETQRLKSRTQVYLDSVKCHPDWLVSRLQMYWASHATDVFVRGESFDHVGGDRAPVPTVRFTGTRGTASQYDRPRLADRIPYDDDTEANVTFISRQTKVMEKAHPAKTGRNIEGCNREIVGIARDAAKLYAATGDTVWLKVALPVFDTYMQGIYYRNVPIDLTHSHIQTLVGMTSFEVIHEDILNELTELYSILLSDDFTISQLDGVRQLYDAAFKKWADNIIANGVPHNNWNIIQANFILKIALVLQPDSAYTDGHGREYYLDAIVNCSSLRQWTLRRLADYGYDRETGIWYESPGYSIGVYADFAEFIDRLDREAGIDIFALLPEVEQSAYAQMQYLFPNRMICGFGDTHPNYLHTRTADFLLSYAHRHQLDSLAARLERVKQACDKDAPAALVEEYVTPTFYAPNVSWLMQRTGMNPQHDLSISLNGALGNHQHANGISMELYGKGFVLGPDAGIGQHLYSGADYNEYYSRFPAHNTVCVDGVSDHAVMMSQHPFEVQFINNGQLKMDNGQLEFTASQVYFHEPETHSDQLRTNGIVKTSESSGYYIDIFRSRRQDGKDKFHDYFYHNLGQTMTLTAADGADLALQPTDELAFAGGHLYAYSYIYNKESTTTDKNVKVTFTTDCPDGRKIDMTMWMQGSPNREVFRALSPVNREYERLPKFMPYKVDEQPVLTYVARQQGDAWTHPFVAVFEPSSSEEPSEIVSVEFFTPSGKDAVGIKVKLKNGRTDYIFSAPVKTKMKYRGMKVNARYVIISDGKTLNEE